MTVQIALRISDELAASIDEICEKTPIQRSELIRIAVAQYVAERNKQAIDAQIVAGYLRYPDIEPDVWGDLRAQSNASNALTATRLDAEDGGW